MTAHQNKYNTGSVKYHEKQCDAETRSEQMLSKEANAVKSCSRQDCHKCSICKKNLQMVEKMQCLWSAIKWGAPIILYVNWIYFPVVLDASVLVNSDWAAAARHSKNKACLFPLQSSWHIRDLSLMPFYSSSPLLMMVATPVTLLSYRESYSDTQ